MYCGDCCHEDANTYVLSCSKKFQDAVLKDEKPDKNLTTTDNAFRKIELQATKNFTEQYHQEHRILVATKNSNTSTKTKWKFV